MLYCVNQKVIYDEETYSARSRATLAERYFLLIYSCGKGTTATTQGDRWVNETHKIEMSRYIILTTCTIHPLSIPAAAVNQ